MTRTAPPEAGADTTLETLASLSALELAVKRTCVKILKDRRQKFN